MKSDIGSAIMDLFSVSLFGGFDLPRGFANAWDKAFVRRFSEAGAAHAEVSHKGALSAATEATINDPRLKFRGTSTSCYGRLFRHLSNKIALLGAHKIYAKLDQKSNPL